MPLKKAQTNLVKIPFFPHMLCNENEALVSGFLFSQSIGLSEGVSARRFFRSFPPLGVGLYPTGFEHLNFIIPNLAGCCPERE